MATTDIHVGDIGTQFKLTVKRQDGTIMDDLGDASLIQMKFGKPDNSVITRTAALFTDGTDGIVVYESVSGDIDQSGRWRMQVVIEIGGAHWSSEAIKFRVDPNVDSE